MSSFSNFYDDFEVGQVINHPLQKTISTGEHQLFSLLTMNHHLSHISENFAKQTEFGRTLVNGTYVFSLVVGITVPEVSFNAIANLGYSEVVHLAPVFEGDTIFASTEVLSKRLSKSRENTGLVEVVTTGFSMNEPVIRLKRSIMIKRHA